MIKCTCKGCDNFASETFTSVEDRARWLILRACRCGAYRSTIQNPMACKCRNDGPFPVQYWPNLDWSAFGGVEEVVLCPECKAIVYKEILIQRGLDPSMNSEKPNRGNVH